jgi:hypothetical protein
VKPRGEQALRNDDGNAADFTGEEEEQNAFVEWETVRGRF